MLDADADAGPCTGWAPFAVVGVGAGEARGTTAGAVLRAGASRRAVPAGGALVGGVPTGGVLVGGVPTGGVLAGVRAGVVGAGVVGASVVRAGVVRPAGGAARRAARITELHTGAAGSARGPASPTACVARLTAGPSWASRARLRRSVLDPLLLDPPVPRASAGGGGAAARAAVAGGAAATSAASPARDVRSRGAEGLGSDRGATESGRRVTADPRTGAGTGVRAGATGAGVRAGSRPPASVTVRAARLVLGPAAAGPASEGCRPPAAAAPGETVRTTAVPGPAAGCSDGVVARAAGWPGCSSRARAAGASLGDGVRRPRSSVARRCSGDAVVAGRTCPRAASAAAGRDALEIRSAVVRATGAPATPAAPGVLAGARAAGEWEEGGLDCPLAAWGVVVAAGVEGAVGVLDCALASGGWGEGVLDGTLAAWGVGVGGLDCALAGWGVGRGGRTSGCARAAGRTRRVVSPRANRRLAAAARTSRGRPDTGRHSSSALTCHLRRVRGPAS
ncbi:hypothetical protein Cph01nite_29120 [Cellulomonas phragmiteti]|uniref:Uncharacterized protein n=1 Tax=Cellulomonas phragmiteti TaxID=478780 RepID=A0ABQ4DP66_9CELL|nr:hypothetical protein Cph01nite_29120 [Cellulomonas phragmiteti]